MKGYREMTSYSHEIISDDTRPRLHFAVIKDSRFYSPMHWHGHLEIIYPLKGYMTAFINEQKYTLSQHDILIVNPHELHSTRTHGGVDYLLLQIPMEDLSRVLDHASSLHIKEYFPSIIGSTSLQKMRNYLQELCDTYENPHPGYLLHFSSVLYEFLYELYGNHSEVLSPEVKEKEKKNFERMDEILQYIRSHYQEDITLHDAASALHVSHEYFCRLFRKHTGQTFLSYLNAVRTMHFHEDLLRTDASITELLQRHGIQNYKVFLRDFKATYGCSPAELRKAK
mgnify:FL=1